MDTHKLLHDRFGFSEFRPGQEIAIDALDRYGAALAVFPTGAGKSLCYQLPALAYEGVTVVVSPLIALMKDQIDFLRSHGIAAARLDSSLTPAEVREINDDLYSGRLKLLYVAPERFNNERFLERLRRTKISLFAVDEAHCISEWGHNFRPDYLKIADSARQLGAERVLALTATATPSVVKDICAAFHIRPEAAVVTGFYRENLNLCITPVSRRQRDDLLVKRLQSRKPGPTIVYVTLQRTAEAVAQQLQAAGFSAKPYHAGMDPEARTLTQEWWMEHESATVVATIAFGMGIDKANVRYVYHYNLPKSLESYSQEIGRAGRDNQRATVEMFACMDDVPVLENFVFGDTPTRVSLQNVVRELLSAGPEFDVSQYDLSSRNDIRMLVLRTALTYLELLGVLKQGTPFYAGYEFRPKVDAYELEEMATVEHRPLLPKLFKAARAGKSWFAVKPDEAAEKMGITRDALVALIDQLEEKGAFEVKAADVRQRYTLIDKDADADALADELARRFHTREEQEVERLKRVLDLVELGDCQMNSLVAYFGQVRDQPCGHCSYCVTGKAAALPHVSSGAAQYLVEQDLSAWQELRDEYHASLADPRQAARFLCGLNSPALTRSRLGRHRLFGSLEDRRFSDVFAWCGGIREPGVVLTA